MHATMPTKEILVNMLNGLAHILCIILFISYVVSIFKMYLEKYTATLVDFDHNNDIELPTITICLENPLREKILPLNDTDFMKMTYHLDDFIAERTLKASRN